MVEKVLVTESEAHDDFSGPPCHAHSKLPLPPFLTFGVRVMSIVIRVGVTSGKKTLVPHPSLPTANIHPLLIYSFFWKRICLSWATLQWTFFLFMSRTAASPFRDVVADDSTEVLGGSMTDSGWRSVDGI